MIITFISSIMPFNYFGFSFNNDTSINVPALNIISQNNRKPKLNLVCLEGSTLNQARLHFEIDFNINLCEFFRSTSYSGEGGVIYVNGGSYFMNISNSLFFNCMSNNNGGAIYFSSSNSLIQKTCASKCSCQTADNFYGQFGFITATINNHVEYLSLSYCSHLTTGEAPIRVDKGNQRLDNINSSLNNAYQISGYGVWGPTTFSSLFCTFSNNKVADGFCLFLNSNSGTISYANIVHNNSPTKGVIYSESGSPKLYNCIFDMNQNTLFCVLSGGLEVSHSFISLTGALSVSIAISIANNNSLSKRQTYYLQFYNSAYCNTDIPLRTIEGTIGETPKETLQRTYEDCSELYHTSNMKELSSIFSFQFLNQILILMIA